jgi:hypothetical protein
MLLKLPEGSNPLRHSMWLGRRQGMKKLAGLIFTALLILSVAISFAQLLFSGPAQAFVYDHFTSAGINPNLWVDGGPNTGLFSQPGDGYLHFNDASGGHIDMLRSYNRVSGAFFASMQYSNFQAVNDQSAAQGASSAIQFMLGTGGTSIFVEMGKNTKGIFFQALTYLGGTTNLLNYIYLNVHSGWLGIGYNGKSGPDGEVTLWYDSGAGWKKLDSCAPNFSQAPYIQIRGYDPYGLSLSFQVDQVQILPHSPAPAIVPIISLLSE